MTQASPAKENYKAASFRQDLQRWKNGIRLARPIDVYTKRSS